MHSGLVPQATLSANASGSRGHPEKRPRSPREKALPGHADGIHAPPGPHPVPHPVTQVQAPAGPHHSPASQVTWRPGQARAQPKNGSHTQNTEPRQVWSLAQLNSLAILSPYSTPNVWTREGGTVQIFQDVGLDKKCKKIKARHPKTVGVLVNVGG